MARPTNRVTPSPATRPWRSLAAAVRLVGPPLIWAIHFLFCYVVVSLACAMGVGNPALAIAIATVVAATLLGLIGLINARKWRTRRDSDSPEAKLDRFFSFNAMALSALSVIALLWVALPAALLPPCAA